MKKTALVLACMSGCAVAGAQLSGLPPDVNDLTYAFSNLWSQQNISISGTGTQTIKGRTQSNIEFRLDWSQNNIVSNNTVTSYNEQAELSLSYPNSQNVPIPAERLLGDGNNFYAYHLGTQEYSSANYGGYNDPQPLTYQRDLLAYLGSGAKGPLAWLTKVLNQAAYVGYFPPSNAKIYGSWMPGINAIPTPNNGSGEVIDYLFSGPGSASKEIIFTLTGSLTTLNISTIEIKNTGPKGGADFSEDYTLTFSSLLSGSQNFTPWLANQLVGWRPLALPQPLVKLPSTG